MLVKTNLEDGFPGGMGKEEGISVARILEEEGADALVLSGGFVSKTPFYMMRGLTPHRELISYQKDLIIKTRNDGLFPHHDKGLSLHARPIFSKTR